MVSVEMNEMNNLDEQGNEKVGSSDKEEVNDSNFKMNYTRPLIVVTSVVLLCVGLGVGLGLTKKQETNKTCFTQPQKLKGKINESEVFGIKQCITADTLKCPKGKSHPPLIILSLDGFRAEYLLRNMTPNLEKIKNCGVHSPYMRAAFPTVTIPNHRTLATGLYPESHGIIDNEFFDIVTQRKFTVRNKEKLDKRWYQGEAFWKTTYKQNKNALTVMWPGADAEDQNLQTCYSFNSKWTLTERIAEPLEYFNNDTDPATHPDVAFIYLDQPDKAGHKYGPYDDLVNGNLSYVDNLVGRLVNGMIDRGYGECMNIIIVADHGMEKIDCGRAINITKFLTKPEAYHVYNGVRSRMTSKYLENEEEKIFFINTNPVSVEETLQELQCKYYNTTKDWYSRVHKKEDLPKRYHYSNNPYIDDIVFDIQPRYYLGKFTSYKCIINHGSHGSDNTFTSMHAIFLGMGSLFKRMEVEPFESIQLYNLYADLANLKPSPNNGSYGSLHHILNTTNVNRTLSFDNDYDKDDNDVDSSRNFCEFPNDQNERNKKRNTSGLPTLPSTCFSNKNEEELDKQMNLSESDKRTSLKINLPFKMYQVPNSVQYCSMVQRRFVTLFDPTRHMPLWTSFSVTFDKNYTYSNVLENTYLTDQHNYGRSCIRADVRDDNMVNYENIYGNKNNNNESIVMSLLFPPGYLEDELSSADAHTTSNVVPMYVGFQKGIWKELLHLIEEYSEKYRHINVVLGPIFDYNFDGLKDSDSDIPIAKYIDKTIPVPTHYFAAVFKCKENDSCETVEDVISFVLPHKPDPQNCWNHRVADYIRENTARLRDIELLTGIKFLRNIVDKSRRRRYVTYLSEKLWNGWSWDDASDPGMCPDIELQCPAGYSPSNPPLFLISLDGFRPDYLDRKLTPVLEKLRNCGVTSESMTSIYPSLTFPNHNSIITGLYPESHGIIDNMMYDSKLNKTFNLGSPNQFDTRWWVGEPLWVTAIKQNKTAYTYFWPGTDVEIHGIYPTKYAKYSSAVPHSLRVDTVLDWLKNGSVDLMTLYFSRVDEAGHRGGPVSVQVNESLVDADEALKKLMDGIFRMKLHNCINIIIISDHGMSPTHTERSVNVSKLLHPSFRKLTYIYDGASSRISTTYTYGERSDTVTNISPEDQANPDNISATLNCKVDKMVSYNKREIAKRYHYVTGNRIDDVILMVKDTWQAFKDEPWDLFGNHGWDPQHKSMEALFVAWGPSFKSRKFYNGTFENIELYNLMSKLLGIEPSPNNGTFGSLNHFLKNETSLPVTSFPGYENCTFPSNEDDLKARTNLSVFGCIKTEYDTEYDFKRLNKSDAEKTILLNKHLSHGTPKYLNDNTSNIINSNGISSIMSSNSSNVCILHHNAFVSGFSKNIRMPMWSAYRYIQPFSGSHPSVCPSLRLNQLIPDPRMMQNEQIDCKEWEKIYDDGSGDYTPVSLIQKWSSSSADDSRDTELLTNIVPMNKMMYSETWCPLMEIISKYSPRTDVVLGPIFDYDADGLIDSNITRTIEGIPIPSHYYAILLPVQKNVGTPNFDSIAFVIPNNARGPKHYCQTPAQFITENRARIRDIELLTNLEFLTKTPSDDSNNENNYNIRTRLHLSKKSWTDF